MAEDDLSARDKVSITVSLRDYFEAQFAAHEKAHTKLERDVEETAVDKRDFDRRVSALEAFRSRAVPVGVALVLVGAAVGGIVGALVEKALGK